MTISASIILLVGVIRRKREMFVPWLLIFGLKTMVELPLVLSSVLYYHKEINALYACIIFVTGKNSYIFLGTLTKRWRR